MKLRSDKTLKMHAIIQFRLFFLTSFLQTWRWKYKNFIFLFYVDVKRKLFKRWSVTEGP
jgi:hypothetical protein